MKRIFLLKGLDCPNCSAKIEKEVGELDGVQSSVVNLMKQTLTINVTPAVANTIVRTSSLVSSGTCERDSGYFSVYSLAAESHTYSPAGSSEKSYTLLGVAL